MRGGRLYDSWYAVLKADKPTTTHPAWPASNTRTGELTWRCKNCHGWDYKGRDGAYATGTYKTGIVGIERLAGGDPAAVVAILKNETHALAGKMREQDFQDLALFVTKGQRRTDQFIDRASKAPIGGNAGAGKAYYDTLCEGCHGKDGKLPMEMPEPLGLLTARNPWESLHKIVFGQAGEAMPAMLALDVQITRDVMAYVATLPRVPREMPAAAPSAAPPAAAPKVEEPKKQ